MKTEASKKEKEFEKELESERGNEREREIVTKRDSHS